VPTPLIVLLASAIIYPTSETVFPAILLAAPNAKQPTYAPNANQPIRFQVRLVSLVTFQTAKTALLITFAKLVIITELLYFPPALLVAHAFNAAVLLIVFLAQPTICVGFV
jgi:hypothetical protein